LNWPDLTKEKFIYNRYIQDERLYRTGDLARWLPDGNIEFLGRKDNQVKIRGYRIELGEIESVLARIDFIEGSCVLVKKSDEGIKRLVGYVVVNQILKKELLQEELSKFLPDYKIPKLWIALNEFPLTRNGKLDKSALRDLDLTDLSSQKYVAPRNNTEKQLITIWQDLLGIKQVGIYDNFFELGGDSIISIQLVTRMRNAGYIVKPSDIFKYQTISGLSGITSQGVAVAGEQGALVGKSVLMPIQALFFETHGEVAHYNQSVLLSIDKSISASVLQRVTSELISYHDALRFHYKKDKGFWQQYYGDFLNEDMVKVIDMTEITLGKLASSITTVCEEYQSSFNLEKGPLFKVVFIQTPEKETYNRLFLVAHHLVIDGVSWRILLDDLSQAMLGQSKSSMVSFGQKGSSYREWVSTLQQYARNNDWQLSYWEAIGHAYQRIPVDRETSSTFINSACDYQITLEKDLTTQLIQAVNKAYGTEINDILLSCLALTIGNWSNYDHVIVGLEGHGREDLSENIDLSHTVGWFTNLYPILLNFPQNADLGNLIKVVKEQLRAIPDKGLGYGALRYLHTDESIRARLSTIKWDIVFNYLGQLDQVIEKDNFFHSAPEDTGSSLSTSVLLEEKLGINGSIIGGKLILHWTYSSEEYNSSTIEEIAETYLTNLKDIIAHCLSQNASEYTPSDYGLNSKQEEINDFINEHFEEQFRV